MNNLFKKIPINFSWKYLSNIFLILLFFALAVFRWHNVFAFNPYWGYDGGGHIDYILSLFRDGRLPNIKDNYLAWHEPLYYLLTAGYLKLIQLLSFGNLSFGATLHYLGFFQFSLSIATSYLIYKLVSKLTANKWEVIICWSVLNLLPSMNYASTFITNELLNYFFILLIIYYFVSQIYGRKTISWKSWAKFGLIVGLSLLTKITGVIVAFILFAWLIIENIRLRRKPMIAGLLLSIFIALIINLPWIAYRFHMMNGAFAINNIEFVKPVEIKLDQRVSFFANFDWDIFKFPYYYSGARYFWSILYADSFYDYYGAIENKDLLDHLKLEKKLPLIRTTHLDGFVLPSHFKFSQVLVWLGIIPAILMIMGFLRGLIAFKDKAYLYVCLYAAIPLAFLSALIYYAYRYPYYDKGIIKSIFIFPAYVLLLQGGLSLVKKISNKVFVLLFIILAVYCFFAAQLFWVIKYNY